MARWNDEFGGIRDLEHARDLKVFGDAISRWRKTRGLTAALLAEQAGISRDTLRSIEHGTGKPSLSAVFSVLRVLGIHKEVLSSVDPLNNDFGRMVADRAVRKRVRMP